MIAALTAEYPATSKQYLKLMDTQIGHPRKKEESYTSSIPRSFSHASKQAQDKCNMACSLSHESKRELHKQKSSYLLLVLFIFMTLFTLHFQIMMDTG